jgi:DNA-binding GntR family transcriptional regulator
MPSRVRPVERENLGQKAYWELREALLEGRFLPGERIRLRELAEGMGISVTPVREAVLQLVNDGALHLKSPRDIRVRELSAEEYLEVVTIRKYLEGEALDHFLRRMTTRHMDDLERIDRRYQTALDRGDYRAAVSLDRQFMSLIFDAAQLPLVLEILDRLWLLARPTVTLLYSDEGTSQLDMSNQSMMDALRSRDARAVKAARGQILDDGAEVITRMLEAENDDEILAAG